MRCSRAPAPAGCRWSCYLPKDLVGNACVAYADLIDPANRATVWSAVQAAIEKDEVWTLTYPLITRTGEKKWVWERGVAVRDASGAVRALEGLVMDVATQHEAEQRLHTALGEWRDTVDTMTDSIALLDAEGTVVRANSATTKLTAHTYSELVGRRCYEVFHGTGTFQPECPHQKAIRSGHAETSLQQQDGRWLRISFQPIFDERGKVTGGVHVVTDVSELESARRQLLESVAQQQTITDGVISAIAETLGFDEDRLTGLRVAAMVHDVGKIMIPAEVLSKPGSLSSAEFGIIKDHSRASHDILSSIRFPWPIADAVLQQHERLDGSGVPQGLSGDAVILEAKIIAVADVVEAMSSHRPYRAALGMDAALAEIHGGAGVKYDAEVVAACLRVIEDRGFRFTS